MDTSFVKLSDIVDSFVKNDFKANLDHPVVVDDDQVRCKHCDILIPSDIKSCDCEDIYRID